MKGLTILNLQSVSPKTFLEFWPSINNCFFLREISQKLGTNKGSKRCWWRHVTSVYLLGLRFWRKILLELSWLRDVFEFKKGIMKQMKIVKMVGELSSTIILRICRHLVQKINILHSCKPFYVKLVRERKKKRFCKIFYELKFRLHVYTYLRVKNDWKNKNTCHIHFTFFGTKVPLVYDFFVWKLEGEIGDGNLISPEELH